MASTLTEAQLAKLSRTSHLKSLAQRVKVVADNLQTQITTLGNDAIKIVQVNGTALTATNNTVNITATLEKLTTAENGFASSYQMKVNGTPVGDKINIAKDYVVKSATLKNSTAENYAAVGCSAAGKKYIDLVINTKADGDGNTETDTHIYLPVEDLVDVYTNGHGLNLVNNEFSIKINSSSANGLSVDANGLALGLATPDSDDGQGGTTPGTAGAMSAAQANKLAGISQQANKVLVPAEGSGVITIDGTSQTVVYIADDADVTTMLDEELPAPAAAGE